MGRSDSWWGRNGHGAKWPWGEMAMGRNDRNSITNTALLKRGSRVKGKGRG